MPRIVNKISVFSGLFRSLTQFALSNGRIDRANWVNSSRSLAFSADSSWKYGFSGSVKISLVPFGAINSNVFCFAKSLSFVAFPDDLWRKFMVIFVSLIETTSVTVFDFSCDITSKCPNVSF